MLRFKLVVLGLLLSLCMSAQTDSVFHTYVYNEEYKVYLDLDLTGEGIGVPGQDVFGKVPGYLGAVRDSRKWLVTDVKTKGNVAKLDIVNDYGSEDLEATLTYNPKDGTYRLQQGSGSRIKIVVNRKWVKLPSDMVFVRHERVPDEW